MKLVRGDRLTTAQRRQVLSAFVHRWTHENARHSASVVARWNSAGRLGTIITSRLSLTNSGYVTMRSTSRQRASCRQGIAIANRPT